MRFHLSVASDRFLRFDLVLNNSPVSEQSQILYECNFDAGALPKSCLLAEGPFGMLVEQRVGTAGLSPPVGPLSDVTASRKSEKALFSVFGIARSSLTSFAVKETVNGEMCTLPYNVNSFSWDMYFCNNGFCPTPSDPIAACNTGLLTERSEHRPFFWIDQ